MPDDRENEPGFANTPDEGAAAPAQETEAAAQPEAPEPETETAEPTQESREIGIMEGVAAALNGTADYRTHTDNLRAEFVARSESFKVHIAELEAKKAARQAQLDADVAARRYLFEQEIARLEEQARHDLSTMEGELRNMDHADRVLQASLKHL